MRKAKTKPTKNPAAVALGRLGGSKTSPRKAASSRANGAKRGRKPGGPTDLAEKLGISRQAAAKRLKKQGLKYEPVSG